MNKLFKNQLLFSLLALFFLAACGDDDTPAAEEEKIPVAIDNPDEVTNALTVEGATLKTGTPPAPSNDTAAPVLDENIGDLKVITGTDLIVPINETNSGDVAGVYIQVKGASEYYDVPASKLATGGRIAFGRLQKTGRTMEDLTLSVGIPDNLSPGEFCVLYCVYDQESRVSNIIEECITVLAFGGEESAFLTDNEWEMVSQYEFEEYSGSTYEEETLVGVTNEETYTSSIPCDDQSSQEVEVTELRRIDYIYAAFSKEGGFQFKISEYEKERDYEKTNCTDGLIYEEKTVVETFDGAWSYDSNTAKITLIGTIEDDDIDSEFEESTFVEIYDVVLENGNLKLSNEEGTKGSGEDYYYFEIIFKPRS
ncbi:hypothetical protein FNH22_09720 [Fulvivirga sp. M361]|uniref:hypothetical protein n=1 Tax=Fulvivirga sp. M361 TaxID=2594266 RepID=UPI00117B1639|nr:hypothetical protein [Fulvivirga sp. M361]TRX59430.1 hypothetical protein FNH22_09720 [Fulvivirga sp. M361]